MKRQALPPRACRLSSVYGGAASVNLSSVAGAAAECYGRSCYDSPLRVRVAVQDPVGHVAGLDDRAGHDAADLLARPRKTQHRTCQDAFPGLAL